MAEKIPQQVLSDMVRDAVGSRRVKVAAFFTFTFDPGFFEEEILPTLFEQSFSHIPKLRLLQLEDALLRDDVRLAVYYDRRALAPEAQSARLDYERIGVARSTGYFHPKNILVLLENREGDNLWDSLLVITLSANLTRSGWWENVEVAHAEEVHQGEKCSFRQDLLDLIGQVRGEDHTDQDHTALDMIYKFVRYRLDETYKEIRDGIWKPRLYVGNESLTDFLYRFVPADCNLEIISPYFDNSTQTTASATTLSKLCEALQPKEVRVFLPRGKDGAALCHEAFFTAVEGLPRVKWGRLPDAVLRPGSSEKSSDVSRFVHAKVYRFWTQAWEIFFIGSPNLTGPAHSAGKAGNFETGILVETLFEDDSPRLGWWLPPTGDERPKDFKTESSEDKPVEPEVKPVTLRFNWETGTLDYFWERIEGNKPRQAVCSAQGIKKFTLAPIQFGRWVSLATEAGEVVRELLRSTSFVEMSVDSDEPFRVLVREEGMAYKPSIFLSLTAEEILQYWSLLSPEQREAFLSARVPDLADGTELALLRAKLPQIESMFDKFAGIFHAFGRLKENITQALEADRESEAVYRLFGEKYDSLPSLVAKVIADEAGDPVNRYVTLLCAQQLLRQIRKTEDCRDFVQAHRSEFDKVERLLTAAEQIRDKFTFDTDERREQFFAWFERMFFLEIPIPEEVA